MALKFLAKKKFHTSNLNNVEKVWIAEQKADEESRRLEEFQKQITEERQIQELRNLQVQHGMNVKTIDTSMDWMYEGPGGQDSLNDKANEEFLLGKIYKSKNEDKTDLHKLKAESAAGAIWLNKVNAKNDSFTRLHEDPLLAIKQKEKQARENVLNNPVKMARIRNQLTAQLQQEEEREKEKKKSKKSKKESKKEKKHKKSSKHRDRENDRSESDDSSSETSVRSTDKRDRSRSRDHTDRQRRGDSRERSRVDSRVRNRTNSRDRSRDRTSGSNQTRKDDSNERDRNRNQARGNDRHDRDRNRDSRDREDGGGQDRDRDRGRDSVRSRDQDRDRDSRDRDDGKGDRDRDRGRGQDRDRDRDRDRTSSENQKAKADDRYGLQSRQGEAENDKKYLGPNPNLLAKKAEKEREEALKKAQAKQNTVHKLSEEEKRQILLEMEQNARVHDEKRMIRHTNSASAALTAAIEEPKSSDEGAAKDASFMRDMRHEVYNTNASMEERLKQNRYYSQRGGDADSEGFLKRK